MDKAWEKLVERVALEIWEGRRKGVIDDAMTKRHAEELMKAVVEGLGYGYSDDLTPKQAEALTQLQTNVYHFSGAKNWNQLKEFSALLTGSDGLKSFNEFLNGVRQIDKTYNQTYLRAEYNHAVTSAQMTSKWQQFEEEADTLPYLQYVAVMDSRTREDHARINDVVRPLKDNFWKTYYPPNGWNCRCSVLQLDEVDADGAQDKPLPEMPKVLPMFRNNVGINKEVFDRQHPYFSTIPAPVLKKVLSASGEIQKYDPERLKVLLLDRTKQFDLYSKHGKTGKVFIHKLVDQSSSSFKDELAVAVQKAKEGFSVEMLPHEFKEVELDLFYKKIFPNYLKGQKRADFRFNNSIYAELETAIGNGKNNLKNAIQRGAEQGDYVIVIKTQFFSWKEVGGKCYTAFNDYQDLKTIEIIQGKNKKIYKRERLIK